MTRGNLLLPSLLTQVYSNTTGNHERKKTKKERKKDTLWSLKSYLTYSHCQEYKYLVDRSEQTDSSFLWLSLLHNPKLLYLNSPIRTPFSCEKWKALSENCYFCPKGKKETFTSMQTEIGLNFFFRTLLHPYTTVLNGLHLCGAFLVWLSNSKCLKVLKLWLLR